MTAYFSYICFILTILVGEFVAPSHTPLHASPGKPTKGSTPKRHVPSNSAKPSFKADFWHGTETHRNGPTRARWEAELHLDTKKAKVWRANETGESTRILILPLYAAHLRQILQIFFLKAGFPELDEKLLSTSEKLDFIVRVAQEVHVSHQGKAWAHKETEWNEVEDDGLFGGEISLYNEEFIDFAYAVLGKDKLEERLRNRSLDGEEENIDSRVEEEVKSAQETAPSTFGMISSWFSSVPNNTDSKTEQIAKKSQAELKQDICEDEEDFFADSSTNLEQIDESGSEYDLMIDRLFESAKQRFFLKYIDEFKFEDQIGLNSEKRLGIVDQGRESFFGEAPPKKVGEMGQANAYNPNFDLISRFVIDFLKIEKDFGNDVLPITGENDDGFPSDDWQLDWPDSAAIRFKIDGKLYDVYFPTRWASVEADRSGLLACDSCNEVNELSNCKDDKVRHNHPNGFTYIELSKKEELPLNNYPRKPAKGYPGINYGYFPLQTPRILRAFQDRPLNAVWSISTSGGLAGAEGARMLGGDSKDLTSRFESLEQAKSRYEYPAKFELMWEGRASFYPPESNVFDLSLYQNSDCEDDKHYKSPNQCLAAVDYRSIMDISDFAKLLKDSGKSNFFWQDQEGACRCRDWRAACYKKGRSRWAVSIGEPLDKSLKLSTPGLQLDKYPEKEIYAQKGLLEENIRTISDALHISKYLRKVPISGLKEVIPKPELRILRAGERVKIISKHDMESLEIKIEFQSEYFENFFFDLNVNSSSKKNGVTELEMIVPPDLAILVKPKYKGIQNVPTKFIAIRPFNEREKVKKELFDVELNFTVPLKSSDTMQFELNRVNSREYDFNVLNSDETKEKVKKTMKPELTSTKPQRKNLELDIKVL
ncbi:MAG: hypothetical protein AB8G05_13865 [Oligoflexales bacterium]